MGADRLATRDTAGDQVRMPFDRSPDRPLRRRGEGEAMQGVLFRDPVSLEEESAALQLEIARLLANARSLPTELPAFDLTLLSVVARKGSIGLVVGKSSPLARLDLTSTTREERGGDDRSARYAAADIVELHPEAQRFKTRLASMAQRLQESITSDAWEQAHHSALRLARIPAGVPLAFYRQLVPGVGAQGLVRVGFRCNQDCGMCWQDRAWGGYGPEQTVTWIEDLRAAGARDLIISGGEPTLDAKLESYIRHARQLGFRAVTLETNAIQFAKPTLAERLRDAGLTECFVSFHSGDAATSDAITRAPGTFSRTVAGIKALLAARVPVRLNCVLTREGIDHVEGVPDFVRSEFGRHPHLKGLMLSQPTDPFDRSLLPTIIPDPERVRAVLHQVIDRAFALGIEVSGLDGPCGPPLCAFGADRRIAALTPIAETLDGRTYLPGCDRCAVRRACFGVRRSDAELYGEACVRPLAASPSRLRMYLTATVRWTMEKVGRS